MRLEQHLRSLGDPSRAKQRGQLLLDLGRMAVFGDLVGEDVLARHRQVRRLVEGPPGPRDALLGVDHQIRDQARSRKWCQAQQRGRRIAPGVGHDAGAGDPFAVQLGETVDGLAEQVCTRVLAVPLCIGG